MSELVWNATIYIYYRISVKENNFLNDAFASEMQEAEVE